MQPDYWLQRWAENRIGFHRSGVNPLLRRFFPDTMKGPGRALVPLCGKSADLLWLVDEGYDVVGVDLSEIAARSFVAENNLNLDVVDDPPFRVFRNKNLHFYVGDFFDLSADKIGRFDLIYDRAALIALPPELRHRYASQLQSLIVPGGTVFLISLEYDRAEMTGPPFAVDEPEVRALFDGFRIQRMHQHDCLEEEPHFRERGLTSMAEVVYLLVRG